MQQTGMKTKPPHVKAKIKIECLLNGNREARNAIYKCTVAVTPTFMQHI